MTDATAVRRALTPAFALVLAVLGPTPAISAEPPYQEPMPELLWPSENPAIADPVPQFIRIDRVLRPDGELDTDLFSEGGEIGIRSSYLNDRKPKKPCRQLHVPGYPCVDLDLEWHDFRSVVEDSDIVVVTRVTGLAVGFVHEFAGTLARVTPVQWLKGEGTWTMKYLFFPVADITIGNRSFCVTHAQHSEAPELKDRVLVAYRDTPLERNRSLFFAPAPRFLVIPPEGRAKLSPWAQKKHPEWVDQPMSRIIDHVQGMIHHD